MKGIDEMKTMMVTTAFLVIEPTSLSPPLEGKVLSPLMREDLGVCKKHSETENYYGYSCIRGSSTHLSFPSVGGEGGVCSIRGEMSV